MQQLDSTVLAAGTTLQLTLTALELSPNAGARIVADWTTGQDPIYIAYRVLAAADVLMSTDYANKTNIHTSNITNTFDPEFTVLQGTLTDGGVWTSPDSGVVVRQLGSTSTQVRARVCACRPHA